MRSKVKSVTASQVARRQEVMKTSFPMKHHEDYPDYAKGEEPTRFWETAKEKQLPE